MREGGRVHLYRPNSSAARSRAGETVEAGRVLYKPANVVYVCVVYGVRTRPEEACRWSATRRGCVTSCGRKVQKVMCGTAVNVIIVVTLSLCGSVDARPLDGAASSVNGVGRVTRRGQAGNARRPRPRKRRRAATHASAGTRRPSNPPASQPAHMAPQLEDVPPVKPPRRVPPKPDKRNPAQ